jgi:hypothetical protein
MRAIRASSDTFIAKLAHIDLLVIDDLLPKEATGRNVRAVCPPGEDLACPFASTSEDALVLVNRVLPKSPQAGRIAFGRRRPAGIARPTFGT